MSTDPTVDSLVQLSFAVQRILASVGAERELSVVQMRLLGIVRDRRIGMAELGLHLGLDKSSVTGLVTRAERRGLVQRSPSPDDGRAVLVTLTPLGRDWTEQGAAEVAVAVGELTAHLGADQRALLTSLAASVVSGPATPR
ncbi:MarR family winged helix-turn-helix transcriptional regulator [Cellulomonas sp. PhB150]|uniref:MarR family winged helix-turn-helix transcriptional regulator n=1 Tax=Cellulomonas sp. PhB150 TaxID=2485188 RepID=UPI000F493299|nr:MarR family transcriptional regulator [Cellulomonas sp. PhB150]ROS30633.1 DNA-binding MarR family transcriptional regulator [Cellulomonas sp. PhB150]